ncbi:hypothetical protein [Natronosalvus rutilus]|uniref:Uncharacterized protein n=1 Tax=Natronosalvus rutilus TaxID=2953753 RepID=A0A9E7NDZ5_9EURY|nr:hypothetical protein [Natronosalvus rutilus]UTF55581.1 hypothetical protein NGM29_19445 [Natronosalvus rutilus]
MKILIVDQCSNSKSYPNDSAVYDAPELDESSLDSLRAREGVASIPARKLYTGRQQQYIGDAIDSLRANGHAINRYFISAGFGVVEEDEELPPYNVTFAEMTAKEIESRSETLGISRRVRELATALTYDLIFFPLGTDYYRALDMPDVVSSLPPETLAVAFNQEELAEQFDNVVSIPARTKQAKEQGSIVVALKGAYLKNFADNLALGAEFTSSDDVKAACLGSPTSQRDLSEF